ncbi:hypothetical protein EVAR_72298_1 [Eumeta japonica]|uniref:Uncharacterized protein n=1 Tax=Eumeta variegata TaxID=151549 RepID=A0A4C1TF00_EUMVA|nr:hypothetical protein EVAR_72298_1 [Eumeta japonica]
MPRAVDTFEFVLRVLLRGHVNPLIPAFSSISVAAINPPRVRLRDMPIPEHALGQVKIHHMNTSLACTGMLYVQMQATEVFDTIQR